ncbi:hypothetical protein SM12VA4_41030 [Serratia marcescens]|nr:hypothetical protein SM12VA4_41030 [Serratia marcescens]CAI1977772.1 Uncharacterised protein [Serratia marcescens]CAI2519811.1 Uncharacterised protein [Serratia marcescens]
MSAVSTICIYAAGYIEKSSMSGSIRIRSVCTIEMDSTPPATAMLMPSTMICLAAVATAIRPEAHWRSNDIPETDVGNPARNAARRPMFSPCTPCCNAAPSTTSSTSLPTIPARSTACLIACPASVADGVALKAPRYALPIGVRAVEIITASRIVDSHWLFSDCERKAAMSS